MKNVQTSTHNNVVLKAINPINLFIFNINKRPVQFYTVALMGVLMLFAMAVNAQCISGDCSNGRGTYLFKSGGKYVGAFKQNKIAGSGVFFYSNGDKYVGEWVNQKRQGMGKMIYKDGVVYKGTFKANKRIEGTLLYPDGTMYSGNFINDKPVNFNYNPNANVASNTSEKEIELNNNQGEFIYADGTKYVGEMHNGYGSGQGICYYINGDRYEGGWQNHAPNGPGIMYYANGRVYGAVWRDGYKVGELEPADNTNKYKKILQSKSDKVKVWAVIVGVSRYKHLQQLKYTDDDAYKMYAFLKSPEGGALPDNQIALLIDEDATREQILQQMHEKFSRADKNDVILMYYSGHGVEGSFLPIDYDGFNNKLKHDEVVAAFDKSAAKHKIVIADACYSGSLMASKSAYSDMTESLYNAFDHSAKGTAFFLSSQAQEYSLEHQGLRQGMFSHFLMRGLKGEADTNGNKIVELGELYRFVSNGVSSYTNYEQNPVLKGHYDQSMPLAAVRQNNL